MDWIFLAELSVNGALTGLLYSLFAIGLVLVYKSSSVPNLAQGALTMLGAYVVLAFSLSLGLPLWVAIPISIVIMFFLGLGIEKVALRRLAGRPIVMILMMTLGIDIFIRGTTMAFWGGTSRPMELGVSYDPFFAGPLLLSRIHMIGAAVSVVLFIAIVFFFRSRLGIRLRAISDDYMASWSVGISVERGVGLSWALASVVAVITGVIWGEIQSVDQSLSLLLLKGLTVAVLGGLDSLFGAVLAGILLGILENVGAAYLDPLVGGGSRDLVVAIVLILTVMIRPHGLFGRHDIERV
ncbi:MAG: branched-chain amino acid ABC transporter permease [Sneathiella sp.]|uniref:branched-chain amino acid ABC transporter permease n=1 Tax=Sneathiella sp. TaxID=1964365 RepID=UPI000C41738A|nr:branched-chain amino acid ABC transporter permease [Sneathiella sp.]MAL77780.1 branched-chain amino acid ABC transporter permease [Sneathiella sp.]|tara:strand:+ start:331 stop:1218 length:888 start_codon:yes stop_codon:yes gene_type:complete